MPHINIKKHSLDDNVSVNFFRIIEQHGDKYQSRYRLSYGEERLEI